MKQTDLLALLGDIQRRCISVNDDNELTVTCTPYIPTELYIRLSEAIKELTPSP